MLCLQLAIVCVCTVIGALAHNAPSERSFGCTNPGRENCYICSHHGAKKIIIRAKNILREPTFDVTVQLNCTRYMTLFYMMQEAAEVNPMLRFTASYNHANHPGFFINAINYMYSTWEVDKSYWEILDGNMQHTPVGVSSYVPKDGETVTFNLTIFSRR